MKKIFLIITTVLLAMTASANSGKNHRYRKNYRKIVSKINFVLSRSYLNSIVQSTVSEANKRKGLRHELLSIRPKSYSADNNEFMLYYGGFIESLLDKLCFIAKVDEIPMVVEGVTKTFLAVGFTQSPCPNSQSPLEDYIQ